MEIPEHIKEIYRWHKAEGEKHSVAKEVANALQWAVAQAVEMEHDLDKLTNEHSCTVGCCPANWLAEADRMLMEKEQPK